MMSKPVLTKSLKRRSLLLQSALEFSMDQSIELRKQSSSSLRLGRVSLRVMVRRLDVSRDGRDVGGSSTTL